METSRACISAWIAIPYTAPYPASIGYHPGRNALIAFATDSTGQITGGQFIHLDRDGHTLAKAETHARPRRADRHPHARAAPVNAAWKVPTILTDASLQIELVRHLWLDMKLAGDIAVDRRATEEIGVAIPRANSRRAGLAAAGSRCQVAHRSAATERWSREGA